MMQYRMSMVHHNPGEPPFQTIFNRAQDVADYGFNSQVFKHVNTIVSFDELGLNLFPENSPERQWLDEFSAGLIKEMREAKQAGLQVYYHIDLFVLPKKIVETYKEEICNDEGKISLDKPKTLEIHRILLDEIFSKFPEIDGLIVRVGETYLHDTPYHMGNGAVVYKDREKEKQQFVRLLQFLREEICVRNEKLLFFRTWDCYPNRFHADLEYYLDVTNQIEPHDNLYFSIKHTALDFWRRVHWNDCLTQGKHKQIVEIQCQREFEGKGAYPSYVMNHVINGDKHLKKVIGLKDQVHDTHIQGIYVWPRGGGWNGPYLTNEFWCKLNTYVISQYAMNPTRTEEEIFYEFVRNEMNLIGNDAKLFRQVCLLADEAILKTCYIEEYDKTLNESLMPSCIWFRDDRLGSVFHLKNAFKLLREEGTLQKALDEKKEGWTMWCQIRDICNQIDFSKTPDGDFIKLSVEYACRLFEATYYGWRIMAQGYVFDQTGEADKERFRTDVADFDLAWERYHELTNYEDCPSLFRLDYLYNQPGMGDAIREYKDKILGIVTE